LTRQQQLDLGLIEASNLAECLSVDFTKLLTAVCPKAKPPIWEKGITRKMRQFAESVMAADGLAAYRTLAKSPSDTVRGTGAILTMMASDETLEARIKKIRPFADDSHFGVREWAWMAIRPHLAKEIEKAIELLKPWTASPSTYVRRFAVEATRPRGVWCSHIEILKQQPQLAIGLLEPLKADPEKYVQDSVSNWLNDAAKTQPEWVRLLCQQWLSEYENKATARIAKRAQRSL
jgi:3-methyladenine DNA glycosylase AlkC